MAAVWERWLFVWRAGVDSRGLCIGACAGAATFSVPPTPGPPSSSPCPIFRSRHVRAGECQGPLMLRGLRPVDMAQGSRAA